jgi:tetratricopeptide (TPR) repeat protein
LKNSIIFMLLALPLLQACASGREFWTYVVRPPVEKTVEREQGNAIGEVESPHVIRVNYSDGSTSTEVQVPILASGQQVIIDQKGRSAKESINLAPLAPSSADKSLEDNYLKSGKAVSQKAPPVSIVKTQAMVKKLVKQGSYSVALEYVDQLLQRYPQHAESLRTKGSLLLKMGERDAALEAYRNAQEIEPNPQVAKQIQDLEKAQRSGRGR